MPCSDVLLFQTQQEVVDGSKERSSKGGSKSRYFESSPSSQPIMAIVPRRYPKDVLFCSGDESGSLKSSSSDSGSCDSKDCKSSSETSVSDDSVILLDQKVEKEAVKPPLLTYFKSSQMPLIMRMRKDERIAALPTKPSSNAPTFIGFK
jgi:hypothetical protein